MIQKLLLCCRQCLFWLLLVVGMTVFFLTFGLALNDLYTISELKDRSDTMEDIPETEVDCLETCLIRYEDDQGLECCDQQTGLCVGKMVCKTNYKEAQAMSVQVLKDDVFTQLIVAAVALAIVIFIPFYQKRQTGSQDISSTLRYQRRKKASDDVEVERMRSLLTQDSLYPSDPLQTENGSSFINHPPTLQQQPNSYE